MTESLVTASEIEPGDEFRYNGEWLEVVVVGLWMSGSCILTVAGEPGEPNRQFLTHQAASRRVRRAS